MITLHIHLVRSTLPTSSCTLPPHFPFSGLPQSDLAAFPLSFSGSSLLLWQLKEIMPLFRKTRLSTHNEPSLPSHLDSLPPSSPPAPPASSSQTTTFSSGSWTLLHIQKQPCRFALPENYTSPLSQGHNAFSFCLRRSLPTPGLSLSIGISASAYNVLCKHCL